MLSQLVELIESKQRFAAVSHIRPDGDGLGSSLGLYWVLKALGKEVEVISRDPVPIAYQQLPGARQVRVTPAIDRAYDAVFVIECSDIERPGIRDLDKQFVVNVDHHTTCALFGAINWIDPTASAVGEMVYNLCKALGVRVTREIAECVYTALLTDTGSFHYSNTSERTFKVASELVRAGVKPAKISQAVYSSHPWSKIELMAHVLATVQRDPTGRVAWLRQSLAMQESAGASEEDGDGLVNYPMTASEVEAAVFLKEITPGVYRTSLRSKGDLNVARIAETFGGGGHRNASGCTLYGNWDDAEHLIIGCLLDALAERDGLHQTDAPNRNGNGRNGAMFHYTEEDLLAPV